MRARLSPHVFRPSSLHFFRRSLFCITMLLPGMDPHSFHPDPDPIRIQGFNDQIEKKLQLKIFLIFFYISKTEIYLSLGLHKVHPNNKRSLQLSKEAIQHFKTWTFTGSATLIVTSVADPEDPFVFGPPGSGSNNQKYGFGSFYHQAKIVRKPWTHNTVGCVVSSFWLSPLKNDVNITSKKSKQKTWRH